MESCLCFGFDIEWGSRSVASAEIDGLKLNIFLLSVNVGADYPRL